MSQTEILNDAIETVYERPEIHGGPEQSFGKIAGMWNAYLGYPDPLLDAEDVANMMICLKVSRNSEGVYHEDNYVDIAGYAECGAKINND